MTPVRRGQSVVASFVAGVIAGALALTGLAAQSPSFDVASVKSNAARDGQRDGNVTGSRLRLTYATLGDLIQFAYPRPNGNLRDNTEVAGGPSWLNSDHFDVVASMTGLPAGLDAANTAAGATTTGEVSAIDRVRLMVQKLLTDRFNLAVHHESRELPAFLLVRARTDGTLGRQFRKADVDCVALRSHPPASADHDGPPCGGFRRLARGHHEGHAVSIDLLTGLLEGIVDRNVIDRTGLSGVFDVELTFTPEQPNRPDAPDALVDVNGPSIFTAVREQLGLRLEAARAPVDVLVIDRAERPSPD